MSIGDAARELKLQAGRLAASVRRRRLRGATTFVGVTGSAAKTTTKELIAVALRSQLRGRSTPGQANGLPAVAKTILRTTRRDAFCVLEVAAGGRARFPETAALLRADIAVVTCIGRDHHRLYRTLEATAAEKRLLLAEAMPDATAVLNADDPHVIGMAAGFEGRVLTFGTSPGADVWAGRISASWPSRLSFTLHAGPRALAIQTQLCGRHWVTAALAALTVAEAIGVPLELAAAAVAAAPPVPRRMCPVVHGDVTFVWDDVKAPLWSIDTALEFLADAAAPRRVLVLGTISDYSGKALRVYRRVAERALSAADEVVFAGPNARHALKARSDAQERLRAFPDARAAAQYLQESLRSGDLVLVKGSKLSDRMWETMTPRLRRPARARPAQPRESRGGRVRAESASQTLSSAPRR